MKHDLTQSDEFLQLLAELTDGTLTDEQSARLRELLRDDPRAQDLYLEYMGVHARLHLDYASGSVPVDMPGWSSMPVAPLSATPLGPIEGDDFESLSRDNPARGSWPASPWWLAAAGGLALAASLLLMLWAGAFHIGRRSGSVPTQPPAIAQRGQGTPSAPFATGDRDALAVLTRVVDARWEAAARPLEEGAALSAGRLRLAAGWVQIEFVSGASVVLEGPADLELLSPDRAFCHRGKLRAHVPPQARGFTVGAPGADAVDLGTEFAMHIDQRGGGEVHVLDGEVELHGTGDRPATHEVKGLKAGRGVHFGAGEAAREIAAVPAEFVGRAQLLQLGDASHRRRYDLWKAQSEAIRSDPALVLYFDFDRHSPWERTLRGVGAPRDASPDGAIVGCPWTEGRWPGKGALEFRRINDRVRIDVPGQFDSLTLAAWVRIESFDQWLSSLMLTDDWDPGEVHWQLSDRGEMILGVRHGAGVNFFSPAVLGPADLGRWVHLATVYDASRKVVLHYLDGRPVSRHDVPAPAPLRIGAAEIGNWTPRTAKASPFRSLNGRIDEFGIFGRPLTGDEIRTLYELGKPSS